MQIKPSALVFAAFGVVPLLLSAGCGASSGDGARSTISPIQPSSYVTIEPATTTTTTTIFIDPSQPSGPSISPDPQTYVVQAGDSLSKIASLYDITVEVLISYNGWTDGTSHLLLPGDEILSLRTRRSREPVRAPSTPRARPPRRPPPRVGARTRSLRVRTRRGWRRNTISRSTSSSWRIPASISPRPSWSAPC